MKAKTFEDVLKMNSYHDARGRFASAPGGTAAGATTGRQYGSTDTSEARRQIEDPNRYTIGGKKNSMDGYLDKDGNLTPEREKVHKEIIDKLLEGKTGVENPTMTMLGGGPASGKSSVMNTKTVGDPHAVTIDPDHIKAMLPGYKELAQQSEKAADFYHEESSALAKRFANVVYSEKVNAIYDGTGDGSEKSLQKKIDQARAQGYRVEGKYATIDTPEALRRNQKRYDDAKAAFEAGETKTPPRKPREDIVESTHQKVTDIAAAKAAEFDSFELWDNNGGKGQQKLIATGGNGHGMKAVPGQEAAVKRFLEKGSKGAAGFTTLPDGQIVPVD